MKRLLFLGLILFSVITYSCGNNESEIAQENIAEFFENLCNGEEFNGDYAITEYRHSNLYILTPKDESTIIKPAISDDKEKQIEDMLKISDSFVGLSIDGCDRSSIEAILLNDNNYRKWETGAKEFVMISFANFKSSKNNTEGEFGLCFKLNEELDIIDVYEIDGRDEDYVYIRLFGQTPKRHYEAINCQYEYLSRMYDLYVKNVKGNVYNTTYKYIFIKELNSLFGYERFKYLNDRDACIKNCINQLDEFKDKEALKEKAIETIKAF